MKEADSRVRLLLTGGSGFTGRHLVPLLEEQGFEVHAPESLDLTDAQSVLQVLRNARPSAVIHLGAISFAAHGDSTRYYETNTLGTLNLLAGIRQEGLELSHLIFASSAAVYGNQDLALLDESLTPTPDSDYGISKLAAEHLVRVHSNAKSTVILRPFNYTGVGQHDQFIIPKLVKHYALGEPTIELGNIEVAREFNDVRWAAAAYVAALEQHAGFITLNLCTGQPYSLRRVMDELAELTSHQPEIQINKAFVRPNDLPSLAGNPERLNAHLNLPGAIELSDTLSWMCAHYASSA